MALSNHNDDTDRLQELGKSDFEIADGQPKIKGWDVKDIHGAYIGEVDELIFDTLTRKVLYLIVDLDDNELDLEERKVLVPIGVATLHEKEDEVILAELTTQYLASLPAYEKGKVTPVTESTIRNTFTGLAAAAAAGQTSYQADTENTVPGNFYEHEHFNQERFYGSRGSAKTEQSIPVIEENLHLDKKEVVTGGHEISSRVIESPVEMNIVLKEEQIHVERTAVDRPATDADFKTFQPGNIVLTEHKEVPVVSKQARVVEEVKVYKTVTETNEVIRDTVRKTQVDTEKIDPETR